MAGGTGIGDGVVAGDDNLRGVKRCLGWLRVAGRAIVNDDGSIIIVIICCRSQVENRGWSSLGWGSVCKSDNGMLGYESVLCCPLY